MSAQVIASDLVFSESERVSNQSNPQSCSLGTDPSYSNSPYTKQYQSPIAADFLPWYLFYMEQGVQVFCWAVAGICLVVAVIAIRAELNQNRRYQKPEEIDVDSWNGDYQGEGTWLKPKD